MIRKIVNILRYVFVRHRKYQFARQGKKVIIGNGCIINSASMIEFGDNVSIGPNAVLYAIYKKIIFGNNVMLGPHVTIVNGDHNIRKIGVAIIDNHEKLPEDDSDVIIGDDVWIGANVTILKGVNIGRGCVVAAGAVVISSFPAYCVVGVVPAHILGIRFNSKQVIAHEKILYPEEMRMKESELDYLLLDDDRKEKV